METVAVKNFDVIIVGAGPAGTTCALALKDSGLNVALIDKHSFPRDKVCGDAIPSRGIKTLRGIAPEFADAFIGYREKNFTKKTRMFYGKRSLIFEWVGESFTSARMNFDNFLFQLVKSKTRTTIFENVAIADVKTSASSVTVNDKNGGIYKTKILIGADGAHSIVAKQLAGQRPDRNHQVGAVRAYYSGITNISADTIDVYFSRDFLLGYLWVFPLPDNNANVGFGMLSSEIARRKLNIKKAMYDFIEKTPILSDSFKNAIQTSELEGFGLPLGSNKVKLSGEHFMLTGDAASLIDPISGEGIGNAMLSGKLAANQVIQCFQKNDFSSVIMKKYDEALYKQIGPELKINSRMQRLVHKMPFLIDLYFWVGKFSFMKKFLIKKIY